MRKKQHVLHPFAADCAGLTLLLGGLLVFLGYFWPELTGWVWLRYALGPSVDPVLGPLQAVVSVVAVVTGIGLLKRAEAVYQIAPPVCFLLGLGFLALAGIGVATNSNRTSIPSIASLASCVLAAVYLGLLGHWLRRRPVQNEEPPIDPAREEAVRHRAASVAAVLSVLLSLCAIGVAAAVACSSGRGFQLATAVPVLFLLNAIGVGLGGGALRSTDAAKGAAAAGALLNLLPVLVVLTVVIWKKHETPGDVRSPAARSKAVPTVPPDRSGE